MVAATAMVATTATAQSGTHSSTVSPYSQYGIGILADQSQGTARAMAGTGLALRGGTLVNTLNPASFSAVDSLTMLFEAGMSGQLTNFKEGGTSVNASKADFDYAVGLFRMRKHLGVSFALLPFSDVGYSYTTTNFLNSTTGSITNTYSGTGGMHQVMLGAGWNPVKPLSIGVSMAYLWGNYTRRTATTATTTMNSLSLEYEANVNTYNLNVGLQWQQPIGKKDALTLGATWGLGHKMGADPTCNIVIQNTSTMVSDTTSFVVDNGLELPMTYGVGMAWKHKNSLTVAADVTRQQWGKIAFPHYDNNAGTYALTDNLLSDRTRVSLGVDYAPDPMSVRHYLKRVHYRLGAAYATPYFKVNGKDGPKEYTLSAGFGLPLQNGWNSRSVLNISAQWVRTTAKDLITDNTFRINLSLTFNERWFAKWRVD